MSVESMQTIIGRALKEVEYRKLLFNDPLAALDGYDLTEDEVKDLKELKHELFDNVISELEAHVSRV